MQAEQLDLLGRRRAGAGLAQIVQFAPLGGAEGAQRVALRVEAQLAEEGRHQRGRQQQHQPRRVGGDAGGEAGQGDDVLRLAEQLADQPGAPARLAPGAVQLILDFAVLEVAQVERRRVLHQAQAGRVAELVGQQRVDQ